MVADKTSLVDAYIEDQQRLTAVERFADVHSRQAHLAPASRYSHLLPLTPPAAGQQYAFEVELDRCSGCKACVAACHSLNGLDDSETWRDVGLLVSAKKKRFVAVPQPAVQHVTTACHHCVDPACLNGCPVLAYDKDPATGIVRHLDDQCIGCQYCVLKCPYDVPKYNSRLGIVRKCDMCSSRLAAGEAPACAQACPNEAIRIRLVDTASVPIQFRNRNERFLSGAPPPDYTLPTTRFVSRQESLAALVAADASSLRPQPSHWPLVFMLVLSQGAVGIVGEAAIAGPRRAAIVFSLALLCASMAASVFHLGKPLGAWRSFLGLRRSWLSREIVVFATFLPLLVASFVLPSMTVPALLCGVLGLFCSAMIYHDTRRELWSLQRSLPLFISTAVLLGGAGAMVLQTGPFAASWLVVGAAVAKVSIEISVVRHVVDRSLTPLKKTAVLVTTQFQGWSWARVFCLVLGGIAAPVAISFASQPRVIAAAAFALLLAGELVERMLFFRAVDAPKMPGGTVS